MLGTVRRGIQNLNISPKITLGFLAVASLIVVVSVISVQISQRLLRDAIGQDAVLLARETIDKVDRSIQVRIEQAQLYAIGISREPYFLEQRQFFAELESPEAYLAEQEANWVATPPDVTTDFMRELIDNELSQEIREEFQFPAYYQNKYGYEVFAEVFVTNEYGANVAQTGRTSDYYQADEEWWQQAREQGVAVTDLAFDQSAGVYSISIGVRVDDADGNFLGVMKAVLNIEDVINIVHELEESVAADHHNGAVKESTALEFKLLTREGETIYATDDFEFLERADDTLWAEVRNGEDQYLISPGDRPGEGDKLLAHVHSRGYRDFPGLGLTLVIEQAADELLAPVTRLRNVLWLVSLVVVGIAIALGLAIARSISRPIRALHRGTELIEEGNLDYKVGTNVQDEIGQLSRSFDTMTARLRQSYRGLEEKVRERTSELTAAKQELENKVDELERFQKLTVNRELKMVELKKEIARLKKPRKAAPRGEHP